jgi:hypothetical protein
LGRYKRADNGLLHTKVHLYRRYLVLVPDPEGNFMLRLDTFGQIRIPIGKNRCVMSDIPFRVLQEADKLRLGEQIRSRR